MSLIPARPPGSRHPALLRLPALVALLAAIAAPALVLAQAQTAGARGDPFETPAVFVANIDDSVVFALQVESRPDGLRRLPVLQMFSTGQRPGGWVDVAGIVVDGILSDYIIDCSSGRYRIDAVTGYRGRTAVASTPATLPFAIPEADTLALDAVRIACQGDPRDWQDSYPDYASKIAERPEGN